LLASVFYWWKRKYQIPESKTVKKALNGSVASAKNKHNVLNQFNF